LDNLSVIGKSLYINSNPALLDFNGLDNLQFITANLIIRNNKVLTNIEALQNLQAIRGEIRISYNSVLSSLIGLQNVDDEDITNLGIYKNTNLSTCGLTNICNYISAGHTADVYNNATDCNNSDEIMNSCSQTTATDTPERISEFSVFPIPSNDRYVLILRNIHRASIF